MSVSVPLLLLVALITWLVNLVNFASFSVTDCTISVINFISGNASLESVSPSSNTSLEPIYFSTNPPFSSIKTEGNAYMVWLLYKLN